ncbi:MAG: LacI family DNA-binding transcriptional regulator [Candidatus Omnitrophica bacterium]|nr:LacI family DNA-binding transcriptional regulator [Candidatus Omnitrophota bacterium]
MNIKQIAKKLKVSTATVSRALTPETQKLVNPKTLQKILNFTELYNYTPNQAARKLVTGKSNNIVAFFKPQPYSAFFDDYYSKFIAGLINAISPTSFNITISLIKDDASNFDLREAIEKTDDIAGAIFCSMGGFLKIAEQDFSDLKCPLLVLNMNISRTIENCFHIDNYKSAYDATEYLIKKGHKKIAIVKGKEGIDCTEARFNGYVSALLDNKLEPNPKFCFNSDFLDEDGAKAINYFFSKNKKERPTAVFFANDSMALNAILQLKKIGLTCPNDVSIMGFDGLNLGRYCDPPLTSVLQPAYEMAHDGITQIIELIKGTKKSIGTIVFPTKILERNSVKDLN